MIFRPNLHLAALALFASTALPAFAAPVLRADVAVSSAIVTVGDMFTGAGNDAERALFRAPAPGTSGAVSLEAIKVAAKRVGITEFDHSEIRRVQVERTGIALDEPTLKEMIRQDLIQRGIIADEVIARISFSDAFSTLYAAESDEPVRLSDLRYTESSGAFSARFSIAGVNAPLDLKGRLDLLIEAPHLSTSLPMGAVLSPDDIEMRPISLRYADSAGIAPVEALVGKALKRPARAGMLLAASNVAEPQVIGRSDMVTLYYRKGPLNLTVKGQALNAAARGETVAVLNLVSKKIVNGIAVEPGAVELVFDDMRLAAIKN
ncbi:flagellar basal body P-ring formation chaperone FlgA [Mariluticola halotolerans]|uniref:flagellar basal body P-ring formation chaperone FlgA n=1 Tax=Mariluticola halotolerans TaxID=2909283 RepID=UPI0026E2AC14|nr:flagellar basal body P-ring formation chaperone FlgA [Mariluticola halotolerans]UJQ95418.1 flagellar basal body P-ring formation chaperone FlgA [Mariluticola halotolerans]